MSVQILNEWEVFVYVFILRAGKGGGTDTSMFFQTYKINTPHVNLNFGLHVVIL